jgi:hypothetical protein
MLLQPIINFVGAAMRVRSRNLLLAAMASLGLASAAHADEPLLGFLYTTDLLPKGGKEVEQWATWRHQKAGGTFDLVEGQTEFSYGVRDNLQLSGYLIYDWTQAFHNAPDGTTTPPEQFSAYFPHPDSHFNHAIFTAVAAEAIWRVKSPYTFPVGIAFLFEPEVGPRFQEIQLKAIFQKNFMDDRLVLVANATWAPEIRELPADPYADPGSIESRPNTNIETDLNFGVGASYRFAPNWSVGWEFQNEREINEWNIFDRSQWMGSAYYTGPSIHYAGKHVFATLTWWQQLPWATNYMDPSMIYKGYDYDVDFERTRVRLKVGYYF